MLDAALTESKFLTGADIECLVGETFKRLYTKYREARPEKERSETGKHAFDTENFKPVILDVMKSMSVFSKANANYLIKFWMKLEKMNYAAASDEVYPEPNHRNKKAFGYNQKLCDFVLEKVDAIERSAG